MRRSALLLATLLGGWLLAGVITAGPAAAHATLVSTDPGEGARVARAPTKVTLTFDEPVSLAAGSARVLGAQGGRVDAGSASVEGPVLTIPLRSGLPDGGYLVTYRVVSADSHPVAGAFSYVVGKGAFVPAGAAAVQRTDPAVGAALPLVRGIGYAGLALAIGIPLLALACWPAGWASPRLRRPATWGTVALAATALASFLLQGPYAAGSGLGSLADPALLAATLGSTAGRAMLLRAVLALALLVVLRPAWRNGTAPSRGVAAGAGVLALGLSVSVALVGHAAAGSMTALATVVTTVHVAAMAVWLGGLAGLLAALLRPLTPAADLAGALPMFSRLAFGSVVALVVTGTLQSVREVGSAGALGSTAYGRLLLVKLALVVVILGAAGVSRVWVQQHLGAARARPGALRRVSAHAFAGGPSAEDEYPESDAVETAAAVRSRDQAESAVAVLPSLRRSVLLEFACAIAVLAVSAVIVGSAPARAAVAQPVNATLALQSNDGPSGNVQVSVDPARTGPNSLHVYLFDDKGQLTQPAGIQVTLTEREQQIGPIAVPLQPGGPGHYLADGMDIPKAGRWTLTVVVRVDEFTATTASTDFPVR
ncbi:MAG: copper resistance protein CopC [Blastococcus sp.]|nr:copper resistance protein CopC [Blastococcus sp.]